MPADSSILDTFFEECEDLIVALTEGLVEMRDGDADDETVNAVFRAVHSIKGAAGAFALDELVGFAHKFETVLDEVRSHRLETDEKLLRTLQRAGDILADLVDDARDGTPANRDVVDPVLADLQSFLGEETLEPEEEFVFEAMSLGFADEDAANPGYKVSFTPGQEFYATGNDPVLVIAALKELGPATVTVDDSALPDGIEDYVWDKGYLTWHIEIGDIATDLPIYDVFQFMDDICELRVTPLDTGAEAPVVGLDEPLANVASEAEPVVAIEEAPAKSTRAEVTDSTPNVPSPPKGGESGDRPAKKTATTLRVDPERVDRLINAVGELIINQSVISQRIEEAALPNSSELFGDLDDYKLLAREIQEGVMAIRAQPVKPLFQRMLRIAREAADATGKDVELVTEGEATEVDKTVVERLADPLTHMIRNAIDHGIEAPDKRKAAGKVQTGTLRLSANQRSGSIVIEIADDGAGLNRPRIRAIAIEKGLVSSDAVLTDPEIDMLLFAPGFSTAAEVTNLSGRGVGMDVVKTAITALGGRIAISTVPGEGTTFSITLPLTLAVMDGMIITIGGQTMVVPISSILETIRPAESDISKLGLKSELLKIRGEYVPIVDLGEQLGHPPTDKKISDRILLLIQTESIAQCALAVDDIFDQRQVVVKSMQGNYGSIVGVSGATILGDGKIALIIDPDAIASGPGMSSHINASLEGDRSHARAS
ncbi:chemotaxis protein CheA [Yoonia sediminilitoris]|uniref:Chemotaxis protein CheA n=1 Tax=Yoonia sediminilitoris TaxID=1286148 RepID=A0A2T6KQ96_9RHOB|nr:chemotaxis protein CheA [Yoonia sediminilitoris]PUB18737.1 two-component system chemotaxis sensor kinase CheA [Yoonia sediminilitoris]RCW98905.1 two-component system chemotaxis sensor kinase CheA [Yoonia sediminilitoris]